MMVKADRSFMFLSLQISGGGRGVKAHLPRDVSLSPSAPCRRSCGRAPPSLRGQEVPLQSALGVQWACSGQRRVYTDLPTKPQDSRSNHKNHKTFLSLLVSVAWLAGSVVGLPLNNQQPFLRFLQSWMPFSTLTKKWIKTEKPWNITCLVLCVFFMKLLLI